MYRPGSEEYIKQQNQLVGQQTHGDEQKSFFYVVFVSSGLVGAAFVFIFLCGYIFEKLREYCSAFWNRKTVEQSSTVTSEREKKE
jgi:hypothetical protein